MFSKLLSLSYASPSAPEPFEIIEENFQHQEVGFSEIL